MIAEASFPHLLSPARVGSLDLRTRIVMPPMGTNYASANGYVTQRSVDYYAARAAGGVGMVIVEIACVDFPRGIGLSHQIAIDDDVFFPGLSDLASSIKRHGAAALIQLHHAGREAHLGGTTLQPVAPSDIRSLNPKIPAPVVLAVAGIQEIAGRFVDAARRAVRAGFDGVELHAAHSYLLSQFLSPLCDRRGDEYGGTLENRARLLLEIVRDIRRTLGREPAISVRLSGSEFLEGGITIEETCAVARMLEDAGVDAIHVSAAGHTSTKAISVATARTPNGHLLWLAEQVKQAVHVPVIGVGRIGTPAQAEHALSEGKCDLISVGRALIADPAFANKSAEGRPDEIRPCTLCMNCTNSAVAKDGPLVCGNNPATGREAESAIGPARQRRRVFVIGGGVAGMEAARVAALRGHAVTLFERSHTLGGQLVAAAVPPHKSDLNRLREYYVRQMELRAVDLHLGEAPPAEHIAAEGPDAVIVATGSRLALSGIPGADAPNVVRAEDVLLGRAAVGSSVVVVGGELVGCETAEYLAEQGKAVTIVRRGPRLAAGLFPVLRRQQLDRLAELKVRVLTGVQRYEGIDERGATVVTAEGELRLLAAETVVLAIGATPDRQLAEDLSGRVPVVEIAGDAVRPRRVMEAIHEGWVAGMAV